MQATEEIFIGRQPILDRSNQLRAYELLFRSGAQHNVARFDNDLAATSAVISHAFGELGIQQALGPYKGFINCDQELLLSDIPDMLPADKLVLEVLEHVEVTPAIVERCRDLKARGFTLALDDFTGQQERWQPLLQVVEIVKVDLQPLDAAGLQRTTAALRRLPMTLLAEKVDSQEMAQTCHGLGYDLFQGYYFAHPAIISGRKLAHSQVTLMRLLAMVLEDAANSELENVFKREPGLAMNLMRLTNSVGVGVAAKVTSLRQAIAILGRRQLQRWLQLLLYTNPSGGNVATPLLQLAASRGRLMELLAARLHPGRQDIEDRAFMTGIVSLMPTLMGMPVEEVLKGIHLAADVQQALMSRGGELGALLSLTEALETGDGAACHELTSHLPSVDHNVVNTCLAQALAWAGSIGRE